jgi:hypothetical protein
MNLLPWSYHHGKNKGLAVASLHVCHCACYIIERSRSAIGSPCLRNSLCALVSPPTFYNRINSRSISALTEKGGNKVRIAVN